MKGPSDNALLQQRLPMTQLVFTTRCTVGTLLFSGLFVIAIGVVSLQWQAANVKTEIVYFGKPGDHAPCSQELGVCSFLFEVSKDIPAPVHFYYTLTNFYQNHRRWIQSQSAHQIRGTFGGEHGDVETLGFPSCRFQGRADVPGPQEGYRVEEKRIFYYPCGIAAKTVFNDTFSLANDAGELVQWRKEGIAWEGSRTAMFKSRDEEWLRENCYRLGGPDFNYSGFPETLRGFTGTGDEQRSRFDCWHSLADEELMVWMRPATTKVTPCLHDSSNRRVGAPAPLLAHSREANRAGLLEAAPDYR
jgi:hypothetical protein